MTTNECGDCGVQLNPDGTVDALPGEPAEHCNGCTIDRCIGRRRVAGQAMTVRCGAQALPGQRLCEVCAPEMCERHPAYESGNCPGCGTSANMGGARL
jgi:hypothetical protein